MCDCSGNKGSVLHLKCISVSQWSRYCVCLGDTKPFLHDSWLQHAEPRCWVHGQGGLPTQGGYDVWCDSNMLVWRWRETKQDYPAKSCGWVFLAFYTQRSVHHPQLWNRIPQGYLEVCSEVVPQLAQPTDKQMKPMVWKGAVKFSNVLLSVWWRDTGSEVPVACLGQTSISGACWSWQRGRDERSSLVQCKNLQKLLFLSALRLSCLTLLDREPEGNFWSFLDASYNKQWFP